MESLSGKRIFVTGATGFIGGYVARRLHAAGAHVLALERTPGKGRSLSEAGIEVVQGDITDPARMSALVERDVQYIFHVAAWLSRGRSRDAYPVNVDATRHLAELGAVAGVERFVYISSISVYGPQGDRDVDETAALALYGDPYGDSKILAERALAELGESTGLPYVIIRPGMVYGPGSPGWTMRVARWAQSGWTPLIDGGSGVAYPVYIDNLVDLILLAAVQPSAVGQVFNAVDDGPVTLAEFMGAYMDMIPTQRAIRMPCWLARAAAFAADPFTPFKLSYIIDQMCGRGQISNQKAKDLLGWSPAVGLAEGMRRSEQWLRDENILGEPA